MIYLVTLTDKPNKQDIRATYFAEHKQYLRSNPNVKVSGSLLDKNEKALGGAWVIQAESEEEVQNIINKDPFYVNGMRAKIEIVKWDILIDKIGG